MALLLARLDDIYAGQRRLSNSLKRETLKCSMHSADLRMILPSASAVFLPGNLQSPACSWVARLRPRTAETSEQGFQSNLMFPVVPIHPCNAVVLPTTERQILNA